MTNEEKRAVMGTPRLDFDTRLGISRRLRDRYGLQEVVRLRTSFYELHHTEPDYVKLTEFVVYGKFLLNREGEIHQIKGVIPNSDSLSMVMLAEDFLKVTGIVSYETDTVKMS